VGEREEGGERVEVVDLSIGFELEQKCKKETGYVLCPTLEFDELLREGKRPNWRYVIKDDLLFRIDSPDSV